MRIFTRTVKESVDSNLQRLDDKISVTVGNVVSQHFCVFEGVFADSTANSNLAISRALHRAVQASSASIVSSFMQELNLASGTHTPAQIPTHSAIARRRRFNSKGAQQRIQQDHLEEALVEEPLIELSDSGFGLMQPNHQSDLEQDCGQNQEQEYEDDRLEPMTKLSQQPAKQGDNHPIESDTPAPASAPTPTPTLSPASAPSSPAPTPSSPAPAAPVVPVPSLAVTINHDELLRRMDELALELGTQ